MNDIRREFQRVFEFVVKHGVPNSAWTNADIKRVLRWAWDKRYLLIVYDGEGAAKRITAVALTWRTDHPENRYEDFTFQHTGEGEYLHIYQTIVHPEYKFKGSLLLLLAMALNENPGVSKCFWSHKGRLHITTINQLGRELLKWQKVQKLHS